MGRDWHGPIQSVVDDPHLKGVLAGSRLPLDADHGDGEDPRRRAVAEIEVAGYPVVVHLVQRLGDLLMVVRVADAGERLVGYLEQAVCPADRLDPLLAGLRL